jgi:hypothetical protein
MLHPIAWDMFEIEATLELCTVYNGVPYGLAIINYGGKDEKFKGVGIFDKGKLHQTSFACIYEG